MSVVELCLVRTQIAEKESTLDKQGEPPDDRDMEARVKTLEDSVMAMKIDIAVVRSNYVTKDVLHQEMHAMTWKIFGFSTVLVGIVYYLAKYVH